MSQLNIQQKRQKLHQERRRRLINEGVPEDKVDQRLAEQAWAEMPVEQKLRRLENVLTDSFQKFAKDLQMLHHNDRVLADSMDVNFKAFAKILAKLGCSPEEQKALIQEAAEDVRAERETLMEAQQRAILQQREAQEKSQAEEALRQAEKPEINPSESEGEVSIPDGATEFGG